jgi:hypothetical protein
MYYEESIDNAEFVQLVGGWERRDAFEGGAASIMRGPNPQRLLERRDPEARLAFEAMMEGIEEAVASMRVSVRKQRRCSSPKSTMVARPAFLGGCLDIPTAHVCYMHARMPKGSAASSTRIGFESI